MTPLEKKLQPFINDVHKCLDNKLYNAAICLSLTLPDICSSIEFPLIKSSKKRYCQWLNTHFFPLHDYEHMKAGDVYSLRCAYLHNGTDNIEDQCAREVVNEFKFFYSYYGNTFHNFTSIKEDESLVMLDTKEFCLEIIDSVIGFREVNKDNPIINTQAENMITLLNDKDGFSF